MDTDTRSATPSSNGPSGFSPRSSAAFTSFLADNEAMIAASCGKLMEGVHYRGTFLVHRPWLVGFRTYWAYDTECGREAVGHKALADPSSNFARAVAQLRTYWLKDSNASHRHMALGALLGDKTLGAFFKFTLNTAEAGSTAARTRDRRAGRSS